MRTGDLTNGRAAGHRSSADPGAPTDSAADDVQGYLFASLPALGSCRCGHDLLDHLLANGGCYCGFMEAGTCTCHHFTAA